MGTGIKIMRRWWKLLAIVCVLVSCVLWNGDYLFSSLGSVAAERCGFPNQTKRRLPIFPGSKRSSINCVWTTSASHDKIELFYRANMPKFGWSPMYEWDTIYWLREEDMPARSGLFYSGFFYVVSLVIEDESPTRRRITLQGSSMNVEIPQ